MHPKDLSIRDFSYELPEHRIARYPLAERDASKLLVFCDGQVEEDSYAHLDRHIPEGALLLFNNTKVVEARLMFRRVTGASIELFCLEPTEMYPDITTAMLQREQVQWYCLVGGAKKWKDDEVLKKEIETSEGLVSLYARKVKKQGDAFLIQFQWDFGAWSFAELLHEAGVIPLPPYLNRHADSSDNERYQTVYARHDGSVAAPTAGLHFTDNLLQRLQSKQVDLEFLTLHVGAGTFKPVKSETLEGHEMHAEFIDVPIALIERLLKQASGPIIPVGTTSCRTIETLYWMGVKALLNSEAAIEQLEIKQWDAYELPQVFTRREVLQALLQWMRRKGIDRLICRTQLLMSPLYQVRVADAIITNFHQPNSTLLLLIAAFIGDDWKEVYRYALEHDFRFLSYGDGSLLWKRTYSFSS